MKYRISRIQAVMVAGAITALPLFSLNAVAQIAVSSNDGKVVLNNGTVSVPANPVDDTVTVQPRRFAAKDHCRVQGAVERSRPAAKRGRCAR
jgi:hypothetical protein